MSMITPGSGGIAITKKIEEQSEVMPHIESGIINVQFSTTVRSYNITFKNAFKEPPTVQLTVHSGQLGAHARALINGKPTTTGFGFNTYNSDSTASPGAVHWLAVDNLTE